MPVAKDKDNCSGFSEMIAIISISSEELAISYQSFHLQCTDIRLDHIFFTFTTVIHLFFLMN